MGIFTDKAIEMESAAKTHIAKARVSAKANYENTLADIDRLEKALTGEADKPPIGVYPETATAPIVEPVVLTGKVEEQV